MCIEDLRAAVNAGLEKIAESPDWFSIVRNGGCEQSLRNLFLCELERIVPGSIGYSEASFGGASRIDLILMSLAGGAIAPTCVAEVKFNFTGQERDKIKERLIDQAYDKLDGISGAENSRFCIYAIATLYVEGAGAAAVAAAHARHSLPPYKQFERNGGPNHPEWMVKHNLKSEQLVKPSPVILTPRNATQDGSRAAASVAVIPFSDLGRVKEAFERE